MLKCRKKFHTCVGNIIPTRVWLYWKISLNLKIVRNIPAPFNFESRIPTHEKKGRLLKEYNPTTLKSSHSIGFNTLHGYSSYSYNWYSEERSHYSFRRSPILLCRVINGYSACRGVKSSPPWELCRSHGWLHFVFNSIYRGCIYMLSGIITSQCIGGHPLLK